MSLGKRGKFYWFDFTFRGQRYQRSTRVTNRVAAQHIEDAARTELVLALEGGQKPEPTTPIYPVFKDLTSDFLTWSESFHRAKTQTLHRNNIRVLIGHLGDFRLNEITSAMIEEFKLSRLHDRCQGKNWKTPENQRKTVSIVSVNRAITTLKLLFRMARQKFKELPDPTAAIGRFREYGSMRVISQDEERKYFAAIRSPNLRDAAAIMIQTGMRPEEILGLKLKDIDIQNSVVYAAHRERNSKTSVEGKTQNAPRTIPLTSQALNVLRSRILNSGLTDREAFLFPSRGRQGHVKSLQKQHNRAVARAGIQLQFRLYDLRHTFATRAAEAGVELPVLAAILGHSSIQMTMRYVHPQENAKRAAMRKLESVAS